MLPSSWFPEVPIADSEESGTTYAAANGETLINQGKKTAHGKNAKGQKARMKWQLASVTKPLALIGRLRERGHQVIFDDGEQGGGFIIHKETGVRTPMNERNGVYEFDIRVEMPEGKSNQDFRRQGRNRKTP